LKMKDASDLNIPFTNSVSVYPLTPKVKKNFLVVRST
jgi:hypothetical protein